jgi:hypothetical protein
MNKNEHRIWDVLIEDAVREGGVLQPPQAAGDNNRRLLTPVGAPAIDRGRSLRGPSRRKWAPVAVAVCLLIMVAAILYTGIVYLPQIAENRRKGGNPDQPQAAEDPNQSPVRKDRGQNTAAESEPEALSRSEKTPPVDSGESLPDDSRTPESKPDNPVEEPKPTPEPRPDDTVEQPKQEPKPDDTVEKPESPDDTVEKPKQPENTAPEPNSKLRINLLTRFDWTKRDSKELLYSNDGESWLSTRYLTDFAADSWLRSTRAVTLEAAGISLILEGEVHITLTDDNLAIDLVEDQLYLDSRGAGRPTTLNVDNHTLTLASGEMILWGRRTDTDISVYDGEVHFKNEIIGMGQHGKLKEGRFTPSRKPLQERSDWPLLRDLKERVTYREDFDADPKGRLREGKLKDGVISGTTVFWGYPQNIIYEPGMVIRLRVRFTGAETAALTQFNPMRNDNYSHELTRETGLLLDSWYLLEVPVDKFLDRTTHKVNPKEPDLFQNVSIQLVGENAQVELDWVELIRAAK